MRVPFQRAAESMEDADKSRHEVFLFVKFVEHFQDNTADGLE